MNIELVKNRNIENPKELREFINELEGRVEMRTFAPVQNASVLYESLIAGDENFSVQVWLLSMLTSAYQISNYILQKNNGSLFKISVINEVNVVKELSEEIETIEYMKSIDKWHKLIFSKLSTTAKILIYAIDHFFEKELKDVIKYIPLSKFLSKESKKIKILTRVEIKTIENIIRKHI